METIIVEDFPSTASPKTSKNHIIDVDDDDSNDVEILEVKKPVARDQFLNNLWKENKDLAILVEKCLSLDISGGMYRVMKKNLFPMYEATNDDFKKSIQFERALTKVMVRIERDPLHKFSYIKDFCDFLKSNALKRKVPITTISTQVSDSKYVEFCKLRKQHHKRRRHHHKRAKHSIINLDKDRCDAPTIDLELDTNNVPDCAVIAISGNNHVVDKEKRILDITGSCHVVDKGKEILDITGNCHVVDKGKEILDIIGNYHVVEKEKEILDITGNYHVVDKGKEILDITGNYHVVDKEKGILDITGNYHVVDKGKEILDITGNYHVVDKEKEILDITDNYHVVDQEKGILDITGNYHIVDKEKGILDITGNYHVVDKEKGILDITGNYHEVEKEKEIVDITGNYHVVSKEKEIKKNTGHNQVVGTEVNMEVNQNVIDKGYNETFIETEVPNITNTPDDGNAHLEPRFSKIFQNTSPDNQEDVAQKIYSIEMQIHTLKQLVDQLNEAEVTEDNHGSPYIQAQIYQVKIVKLYKQLCELTGQDAVKRRKVRLKAKDSRSTLPLKKLQMLINSKIGSDGLPHFPDLEEVVQCVEAANSEGNLRWDATRVMDEARALFTYCGRALQRGRQRREWRDMMRMVKSEVLEDPADLDPELKAKLENNRLIALKKEKDLLDSYASMETSQYGQAIARNHLQMEMDDSNDEMEDDFHISKVPYENHDTRLPNAAEKDFVNTKKPTTNVGISQSVFDNNQVQSNDHLKNTHLNFMAIGNWNNSEPVGNEVNNVAGGDENPNNNGVSKTPPNLSSDVEINSEVDKSNNTLSSIEVCDPRDVLSKPIGNNTSRIEVLSIEIENSPNEDENGNTRENPDGIHEKSSKETTVSNIQACDTDTLRSSQSENETNKNTDNTKLTNDKNTETENSPEGEIKVKIERTAKDVQQDMNEMDDRHLISTIIGIEDPFLVIEISSDSESDEELTDIDE